MKHWRETAEIVDRVVALASAGRHAALATVIRIEGSSYRRPGAKLLIEEDGRTLGGVSGGCLEADVREVGLRVIRTGTPQLLHYDTGADDRTVWGLGLGCNGSVDIFVQPGTEARTLDSLREIGAHLERASAFAISPKERTMPTSAGALNVKSLLPGYTVDDLDKSIAFYETLGFTVAQRWDDNGTPIGAVMQAGALEVGLNQDDWKKGRDRQKGLGTRLNIETPQNIDEIAARVKGAGYKIDIEPFDTPWKTRQFELTDPSGYKLTISSEWPRN